MSGSEGIRQEAGEPFKRINADVAKDMIDKGGVQVIDVRRPDEWDTGHIPGSVLIPVDDLFARAGELKDDTPIIFVCEVGVRSALACEMAAAVGYTALYNFEGGMKEWRERNFPTEVKG